MVYRYRYKGSSLIWVIHSESFDDRCQPESSTQRHLNLKRHYMFEHFRFNFVKLSE